MKRRQFVKNSLLGLAAMTSLKDLKKLSDTFLSHEGKMPVLFVGHGNPMNAIEENEFSKKWQTLGAELPKSTAILCISAHWETRGTFVTAMEKPQTIHDFGGFPQELFDVQYPAPGKPELAEEVKNEIKKTNVGLNEDWGLDHGCWSVIKRMYPDAKTPVLQLSLDYTKPAQWHYDLAKELSPLRKKGVLIVGSGNMVHNLGMVNWRNLNGPGYDWAIEMNEKFKKLISENNHKDLINYSSFGAAGKLAIPSPEHYLPLLYTLALKEEKENVSFFNDKTLAGSLSMTSVKTQ
ncbi:MAG TPA: 4,5-DOPA dioxygenase extradiol [Bacteroidia bacterium]|jgi:4,5-DOPA dioxygenase extradiol|nr:4,5-DOPA dioxygenase extradiol [Bacteroidia bacterium]